MSKTYIKNQNGQVLLLLLLIMVVALAIGLSVVQKSLVNVSTSTQVEQSSRAFSAAEAGIERALTTGADATINLQNESRATVVTSAQLPATLQALEYPPLAKEDIAHVWLADPSSNPGGRPAIYYDKNELDLYWGSANTTDKPAIEVSIIYFDGTSFQHWKPFSTPKILLDADITRLSSNNFKDATSENSANVVSSCINPLVDTSSGVGRSFLCKTTFKNLPVSLPSELILLRARLLYNTTSQPLALAPKLGGSLPPQARIFTSTGSSGDVQRKIQVFKLDKVVPFYFDFAIFSTGAISK